ncbi:MAG: TIGR01906 family membrane protein [Mogibacterium sp.]|nr:TIGR01906 family membrane protein [Mogibacterium sp.]
MKKSYSPLQHFLAVLIALLLLFILLITATEGVVYRTPGWFEKEYTKYDVLSHVNGEMTMESALQVTDEYMAYLRGDRADLVVMTEIDGQTVEFFTDREKAHMADVRVLFIGALKLRRIGLLACGILLVLLLISLRGSVRRLPRLLHRDYTVTTLVVAAIAGVLSYLVSQDFTKYFTIFHHIFFDNDLWILDPRKDNLINLLPEGFFRDTVVMIVVYFVCLVIAAWIVLLILRRLTRPKPEAGKHDAR